MSPRKGHKEGCQCAICLMQRTKVAREAPVAVAEPIAVPGITLGSVPIGQIFRYKNKVYKKLNTGLLITVADMTLMGPTGEGIEQLSPDAIIEPVAPGHEALQDME